MNNGSMFRIVPNKAACAVALTEACDPIRSDTKLRFAASNWAASRVDEFRVSN